MTHYGKVIAKYRKLNNLTQSQLAEQLFISPQAVSKWEKNQSEPDLATIKKLTEIFGITIETFFLEEKSFAGVVEKKEVDEKKCIVCLNTFSKEQLLATDDGFMCGGCSAELDQETKQFMALEGLEPAPYKVFKLNGKLPFYIGWGLGIVTLILGIISYFMSPDLNTPFISYLGSVILVTILVVSFMTQILYDSWLRDFLIGFFGKTINMPGVIFELSWDGVKFLIIVKLIMGLIVMAFSVAVALFGVSLALLISPISYAVELITKVRKGFDYEIV